MSNTEFDIKEERQATSCRCNSRFQKKIRRWTLRDTLYIITVVIITIIIIIITIIVVVTILIVIVSITVIIIVDAIFIITVVIAYYTFMYNWYISSIILIK